MVNRARCFLAILLFLYPVLGFAQEPHDSGNFFIERTQRFIQRLSWIQDEAVFRYEVTIEAEQDGAYKGVVWESTKDNFLNVSLPPGRYRYQIGVYNFLDELEYTMDWVYFTVLNALQPTIHRFTPTEFFPGNWGPWRITVTGENIAAGAEGSLHPLDGSGQVIYPEKSEIEGTAARLTFSKKQLTPGLYEVYIRNPGGLEDSSGVFTVHPPNGRAQNGKESAFKENDSTTRPDFIVSAGYAPLMPLYGELFREDAFIHPAPLGFTAKGGVLPLKRDWGYLGAELGASWNYLKEKKGEYTISAQVAEVQLGLLYQLRLPNPDLAFNFRLGAGIGILTDFHFEHADGRNDTMAGMYLSLDAGVSFQWHIKEPFFIEAGVDFTHLTSPGDPSQPGYLQPVLNVGWQF
ncbi:hypothetical protein AGMMS49942_03770 [Spirochaetia bacterium]|nr:hypothetical protein AGMMS49942_03770 [Spirochaetia bacterium]